MTTFERIRHDLERSRAAGEDFDAAWRAATKEVRDKLDRGALHDTQPEWRRAYLRERVDGPVLALAALAHDDDREPMEHERLCALCDEPIPDECAAKALCCTDRCRRAAGRSRTVAA